MCYFSRNTFFHMQFVTLCCFWSVSVHALRLATSLPEGSGDQDPQQISTGITDQGESKTRTKPHKAGPWQSLSVEALWGRWSAATSFSLAATVIALRARLHVLQPCKAQWWQWWTKLDLCPLPDPLQKMRSYFVFTELCLWQEGDYRAMPFILF